MKKLLLTFLLSAVLIGIGSAVLLLEISSFSYSSYILDYENAPIESYIYDDSNEGLNLSYYLNANNISLDKLTSLSIDLNAGEYYSENGSLEIIEDKELDSPIKFEVFYRGNKPSMYIHYIQSDTTSSKILDSTESDNLLVSSISFTSYGRTPEYFFNTINYIFKNKTFLKDQRDYIVEKIVIYTKDKSALTVTPV